MGDSNVRFIFSGAGSVHHINRAVGAQDLDGDGETDVARDNVLKGGKFSLGAEGAISLGKGFWFLPGLSVVAHFARDEIDSYTTPDSDAPRGNPDSERFTEAEAATLQEQDSNVRAGDLKDESCFNGLIYICRPDGLYKQDATSHYIAAKLDLSVAGRIGKIRENPVLLGGGLTVELRKFIKNASAPMTSSPDGTEIYYGSQPLLWGIDVGARFFLEVPVDKRFTITPYLEGNFGELEFFPEGVRQSLETEFPRTSGEQQLAGGLKLAWALGPTP